MEQQLFTTRTLKMGDFALHSESFGRNPNPAILLISGAMASARFWTDFFCFSLVHQGYFVIRYDHRDIGESSAVWQRTPYGLIDLAHDAIAILDAYGIDQAHLVGHSMGGYICQQIALGHPQRILSMTLLSSGPIGATHETDRPLTKEERAILETTWSLFLTKKEEETLEGQIQGFLPIWRHLNGTFLLDEGMAVAYTRDVLTRTKHSIRAGNPHELLMSNLRIEEQRGVLSKVDIPTCVIHGDKDPLVLPRDGVALAQAIPHSRFLMINGMGHMLFNRDLEKILVEQLSQCMG